MSDVIAEVKTIEVNEELYRRFFEIVGEGKRMSQARAARELRVSAGLISAYKSRSYNGNVEVFENKIRTFIEREGQRRAEVSIPIVETTTTENISRAVEMAHICKDIAVITGEAGTGKTTAVKQYVAESRAAFGVYVCRDLTQYQLVIEIARAVGVSAKGSKFAIIDRIVGELKGRDTVLIIDQANYLTDTSLELLRCIIVDMAEVGLVLVGLPSLKIQLENLRNDHEQLLSLVGTFLKVNRMRAEDAANIIQSVWQSASEEVITALTKSANGSVRTLVKLIGHVHRIMAVNRLEAPTYEAVSDARELVKG
ncbi:MAG: AAA family ATPase [Treponema sp.]|jgi:DNA transposition AAA+ family ATPase|nr:AAA family ATPase [Treponema sp.]